VANPCLHGANLALVQVLLSAHKVFINIEQRNAPVIAEQWMHAYLRKDILERSYASDTPWKIIQENKDIFTVVLDFDEMLANANKPVELVPKAEYFDAMVADYTVRYSERTDWSADDISALLQRIRAQYEGHSAPEIRLQSSTIDASAEAQQQAESEAKQEANQMREVASDDLFRSVNTGVTDYFSNMERWCAQHRFSVERVTGDGFFPVNDFYEEFHFDDHLLVTGNHKHWAGFPFHLFNSSYQEEGRNKPFDIVLLFQYRNELYTLVCTVEDAKFVREHLADITLPFILYRVPNRVILHSSADADAALWGQYLLEEPEEAWLIDPAYQRIHGMRQQVRILNGELDAVIHEESRWFAVSPQDAAATRSLQRAYDVEIAPYHLGQTAVNAEAFNAAIAQRHAQPRFAPPEYQHQAPNNWFRRARVYIQSHLREFFTWAYRALIRLFTRVAEAVFRWLGLLEPANRYVEPERYIRENRPEVQPLYEAQLHNPRPQARIVVGNEALLAPLEEERDLAADRDDLSVLNSPTTPRSRADSIRSI